MTSFQEERRVDKLCNMADKILSEEQVAAHNKEEDCWLIINHEGEDRVYDVTKYLNDHPGGPEIMLEFAGIFSILPCFSSFIC